MIISKIKLTKHEFSIMSKKNHFKYFKTSTEIIKLAVQYYVRYPLSLRNFEDILYERGIDISQNNFSKDQYS